LFPAIFCVYKFKKLILFEGQAELCGACFHRPRQQAPPRHKTLIEGLLEAFITSGHMNQGCQMAYFQTKTANLGAFWRDLQRKMLVYIFYGHLAYFTVICYILRPFGLCILWLFELFCGHLVYYMVIWYVVPRKIWQP
jgi:hypothetical protein